MNKYFSIFLLFLTSCTFVSTQNLKVNYRDYQSISENCLNSVRLITNAHHKNEYASVIDNSLSRLLDHVYPSNLMEHISKESKENREFRSFLFKADIDFESLKPFKKRALYEVFLNELFMAKESTDILGLRNRSLLKSLDIIGHKNLSSNGKRELEFLSSSNLNRLIEEYELENIELENDIELMIDSIELLPVHFSHIKREGNTKLPILSSSLLNKEIGKGGYNTEAFNREFLKTDDNIFFFPMLKIKSNTGEVETSRYGRFKLSLGDDFLYEEGWVSPFAMYGKDLFTFAESVLPEKAAVIFKQAKEYNVSTSSMSLFESTPEAIKTWKDIRNHLHQYTFMPNDYELLVKFTLKKWLTDLRRTSTAAYNQKVGQYLDKGQVLIDDLEIAFEDVLGIKFDFEYKVPSIIESHHIEVLK